MYDAVFTASVKSMRRPTDVTVAAAVAANVCLLLVILLDDLCLFCRFSHYQL